MMSKILRIIFLLIVTVLGVTAASMAGDWPLFRGNSNRTGFSSELVGAKFVNKWSEYPSSTAGPLSDSPVIMDGKIAIGTPSGAVILMSAPNGSKLWEFQTDNSILAAPAMDGQRVYAPSLDKKVYIIDELTGNLVGNCQTGGWLESSPILWSYYMFVTSEDHYLYAFNKNTSALLWKYKAGGDIFSSPALSNGILFFGCGNDSAYAVNTNGNLIWKKSLGGASYAAPVVVDDKVIFVTAGNNSGLSNNRIVALKKSNGATDWIRTLDQFDLIYASPAVGYGMVFYATAYGKLGALDVNNGEIIWEQNGDSYGLYSSPLLADRMLFIGSHNGYLLNIDPFTGKIMAATQTDSLVHSSPALSNGILAVGSMDRNLYAFDVSTDLNINIITNSEQVSRGDNLLFTFRVTNSIGQEQTFDGWAQLTTPVGTDIDIAYVHGIRISPLDSMTVQASINVPYFAPLGRYVMTLKLGTYPNDFREYVGFPFEVTQSIVELPSPDGNDSWHMEILNSSLEPSHGVPTSSIPDQFALHPAYPNPFNSQTRITYSLPEDCWVKLEFFNLLGERSAMLVEGHQTAGQKSVIWDGTDGNGQPLSSGIYFCKLSAGQYQSIVKMTLTK